MSVEKCPNCGANYSLQLAKKIDKILKSRKDPYQKKIALFNLFKDLEVGKMETNQKQRVNCLIQGKFYNELAKEKMKEYKEMVIDTLQK